MNGATVGPVGADELRRLGLSPDEARCYLALVNRGRLTATELATAAGVTRGRVYDVARALVLKGAAVEAASRQRSFQAVEPPIAVANLLEGRRQELAELEDSAQSLVASLAAARANESVTPSFVEALRHKAVIAERFEELQNDAQQEILLFSRAPYYATPPEENQAWYRALARGVVGRCIYESSVLEDDRAFAEVDRAMGRGEQARHLSRLPAKVAVFDRAVTMLPMAEPVAPDNIVVLVVRHPGVSQLVAAGFERAWEQAEPIPEREARSRQETR